MLLHCVAPHATTEGRAFLSQVYLGFPAIAENPPKILRRFARVAFGADRAPQKVAFELTERDVSAWSVQSARFMVVEGSFEVYVASSSDDTRLTASFEVTSNEPWVPPPAQA